MRAALRGRPCYAGLDLSSNTDVTAFVEVFPEDHWAVLPWFWIPEEGMQERVRRDRVPYDLWVQQGFMHVTPGNVIDYAFIEEKILREAAQVELRELAYDPWRATQTAVRLKDEGLTMVECGQGFKTLSEPSKFLETLVLSHRLSHGGNPVLRWMAENVSVKLDPAGNVKPTKEDQEKSIFRIDGIVATVMALWRALVAKAGGDSVYEKRAREEGAAAEATGERGPDEPRETAEEAPAAPRRRRSVYEPDRFGENPQL